MLGNLDFNPELVPRVKLGLHVTQFVLSFVIWALEIAVFRADNAKIVGNNGWTFGVVGRPLDPQRFRLFPLETYMLTVLPCSASSRFPHGFI